jgi:hypothetical protein
MTLLVYRTPQFVYFVIPIAALLSVLVTFGLLSRTSELTVMKACGISLYRVALPIVCSRCSLAPRFFALDQEVLGARQPPRYRHRRSDPWASSEDVQSAQSPVDDRPRWQHLSLRTLRSPARNAHIAERLTVWFPGPGGSPRKPTQPQQNFGTVGQASTVGARTSRRRHQRGGRSLASRCRSNPRSISRPRTLKRI